MGILAFFSHSLLAHCGVIESWSSGRRYINLSSDLKFIYGSFERERRTNGHYHESCWDSKRQRVAVVSEALHISCEAQAKKQVCRGETFRTKFGICKLGSLLETGWVGVWQFGVMHMRG